MILLRTVYTLHREKHKKFVTLVAVLVLSFIWGGQNNAGACKECYNLKNHGVLIDDIGENRFLMVINYGYEEEPYWYLLTPGGSENKIYSQNKKEKE